MRLSFSIAGLALLATSSAIAAECTEAEFSSALSRVKTQAIYELDSGMLLASMDEEDFEAAAKGATPHARCAAVALSWNNMNILQKIRSPSFRAFVCGNENISLTFNVNPQLGLTTFIRINDPKRREISVGGQHEPLTSGGSSCERAFLASLEKTVAAAEAAPPAEEIDPAQSIEEGLSAILGGDLGPEHSEDCF